MITQQDLNSFPHKLLKPRKNPQNPEYPDNEIKEINVPKIKTLRKKRSYNRVSLIEERRVITKKPLEGKKIARLSEGMNGGWFGRSLALRILRLLHCENRGKEERKILKVKMKSWV